jgi:hypothetical protein
MIRTRQQFTDEEWTIVRDAPMSVSAGISALDFGLVSFAKEIAAVTKTLVDAPDRYPNNALIKAVVEDTVAAEDEQEVDDKLSVDEILKLVAQAGSIVDEKVPGDAPGFKQLLMEVADRAANASGSGFLGFGEKMSDEEAAYLSKLRAVLDV